MFSIFSTISEYYIHWRTPHSLPNYENFIFIKTKKMFLLSQKRRGKLFQREVCGNFAMFCDPSGPFSVCWPKLDAVCGEGGEWWTCAMAHKRVSIRHCFGPQNKNNYGAWISTQILVILAILGRTMDEPTVGFVWRPSGQAVLQIKPRSSGSRGVWEWFCGNSPLRCQRFSGFA